MCENCWNADSREQALKRADCDGNLVPFLTMAQLKDRLYLEWKEKNQTSFRIYKEAIFNPPEGDYSWHAMQNSDVCLNIKFL